MDNTTKKPKTVRPTEDDLVQIAFVRKNRPLMKGNKLCCPFCETEQDILAYVPLQIVEKHAESLIAPLKCKKCRHVFALRP